MKSICGISLLNILIEKGVEHDKISADVILSQNKIGELINDGWCEEYYIEFLDEAFEVEFKKHMNKYYKKKSIMSDSYECFVKDLLFISKGYNGIKNNELRCDQLTYLWK